MGKLANRASNGGEVTKLEHIIKANMPKIMSVAPKHLTEERLYQLTLSTINREPKLGSCDIASLLGCVMKCSSLGLEPSAVDGLGRAYILPYMNRKTGEYEATFILGYRGMIDLARRSGQLKSIEARAVYEGDLFEFEFGLEPKLRHVPAATERKADKLTHVYMVALFKDGGRYFDVMTRSEVLAIKERSKASKYGPWVTDFEAMAKKTVIRRSFPYLPVSVEASGAVATEERESFVEAYSAPVEAEVETVENTAPEDGKTAQEPKAQRVATCKSCGRTVTPTSDATEEDLNASFMCCESPDYEISEA